MLIAAPSSCSSEPPARRELHLCGADRAGTYKVAFRSRGTHRKVVKRTGKNRGSDLSLTGHLLLEFVLEFSAESIEVLLERPNGSAVPASDVRPLPARRERVERGRVVGVALDLG